MIQCDCGAVSASQGQRRSYIALPEVSVATSAVRVGQAGAARRNSSPVKTGLSVQLPDEITADDFYVECPECNPDSSSSAGPRLADVARMGVGKHRRSRKTESAQQPLAAWGDTKRFARRAVKIKAIMRCRYCQTDFDSVDPMSLKDLHGDRRIEKTDGPSAEVDDRRFRRQPDRLRLQSCCLSAWRCAA